MPTQTIAVVNRYVKLWPREVFYIKSADEELKSSLDKPGVYILYQDFDAFYIGQALSLYDRLRGHATKRYHLWNHFSAFEVPQEHLDDVEAILIAATPRTFNRSGGKRIERINLPAKLQNLLLKSREIKDEG